VAAICASCCAAWGCDEKALEHATVDAGPTPAGLSPDQAAAVLARVGERTITLGDFAAALERMNTYDRLRFQSRERRVALLEEMIAAELLAQEARRQGLDRDPEVQRRVQQVLLQAMVAKSREGVPPPPQIPLAEVRAYYQQHQDEFSEPERRRVSAIVMTDEAAAKRVLGQAVAAKGAAAWGRLFHQHSVTAPASREPTAPLDLAGNLGIVGPLDDPRGAHQKVPAAVRRAVFDVSEVGGVFGELVPAKGRYYIVRLTARTSGHARSFAEAQRSIRVKLYQQKVQQRRDQMEEELRRRFPVQIDEQALATVELPAKLKDLGPDGSPVDAGR